MQSIGSSLRLLALVGLCVLSSSLKSAAESFTVMPLQYDQGWNLIGIESSGAVVVFDGYNSEYETFVNGMLVSETTSAPTSLDNGSSCAPSTPGGFQLAAARCNGSLQALDGWDFANDPNQHTPKLYAGSDLANDYVATGGGGLLFLNSSGDLAWDDVYTDTIFEAIPTSPTPEPGSLALLASGAVALAGGIRLRRRSVA